jgi:hypothetical protein
MLRESKTKLASLALAGALAVGFAGAASAQDWSQTTYRETHHAMHYRYATPRPYGYGYQREGYYRDGYYNGYRDYGPVGAAGAVVGSVLGAADTAAAVATGYPYGYGYYGPDSYYAPAAYYGPGPQYGNDWWGPYHNQYENGYPQYQNGYW